METITFISKRALRIILGTLTPQNLPTVYRFCRETDSPETFPLHLVQHPSNGNIIVFCGEDSVLPSEQSIRIKDTDTLLRVLDYIPGTVILCRDNRGVHLETAPDGNGVMTAFFSPGR